MNIATLGPENPSSSPKCVTSSSKTQSNNNNHNFVDDQMDSDYRNDITMKTSETEKQGEKMGFPLKNFIEMRFMYFLIYFLFLQLYFKQNTS